MAEKADGAHGKSATNQQNQHVRSRWDNDSSYAIITLFGIIVPLFGRRP